ncbi:uncharacterized protein LOC116409460 [Xenopus tropicalis]|uniref:Uncharacterized protein LOC116409460 n=1 Tax=Xenopus tropicalis TaxID=8364 RepID=A0A8J1JBF1_XENTR|nr:uncharacterized protein LOC116409460 [Xenopus tropicalis]
MAGTETPVYNLVTESNTSYVQTTIAVEPSESAPIPWKKIAFLIIGLLGIAAFSSLCYGIRKEIKKTKKKEEMEEKRKNTKYFYANFGPDGSNRIYIMQSPGEKLTIIYLPGVVDIRENLVTEIIAATNNGKIPPTDGKENNPKPVNIEEPQAIEPKEELKEEPQETVVNNDEIDIEKGKIEEIVADIKDEKKKKKWRFFPFSKEKGKEDNGKEKKKKDKIQKWKRFIKKEKERNIIDLP